MKKVLLATTVLVATAGFAAAEGVAVSGSARMGVTNMNATNDLAFTSRVRIAFSASGETDGGLSFGASVRNDQSGQGNQANGDSTVYISGAFGKLTMGDTGNAADALVGQVSGVGLTSLGSMNETAWLAKNTTGALYEYTTGGLTFALGAGQTNNAVDAAGTPITNAITGAGNEAAGNGHVSVAVKYATDAYSVALGFEQTDIAKQTSLSGSATFSGATVKAKIADHSLDAKKAYALSVDYAISGATVTAFYSDNAAHDGLSAYGLGASYDLGGGASVKGGIAKKEGGKTLFDLGVAMSF